MVKDRAFARWSDADIETFKDAAQGFGEQFKRAWDEYGSSFLNSDEQQRKEQLRKQLSNKLQEIQGNSSPRVLAEALRELLREVESTNIKENNS